MASIFNISLDMIGVRNNSSAPIFPKINSVWINQYLDNLFNSIPSVIHTTYKQILLFLYCIIILTGSVLNIFLKITIYRLRSPETLSNRIMLMSQVGCNLVMLWFCIPVAAYFAVYKNWVFGDAMCHVMAFVMHAVVALNIFLLVAICLNRSIAINRSSERFVDPVIDLNMRVMTIMICVVVFAALLALPASIVTSEIGIAVHVMSKEILKYVNDYKGGPKICKESWNRNARLAYDISLIVTMYCIPLVFICFSQHRITVHLRKSQRLLMNHPGNKAWVAKRRRLVRICVLMACLFAVSWFPCHLCNMLINIFTMNTPATEVLSDFALCLAMSNTVSGPTLILYCCASYRRYFFRLMRGVLSTLWPLPQLQNRCRIFCSSLCCFRSNVSES